MELIRPTIDIWEASNVGPCCAHHGAGRRAAAQYVAADGKTYDISYEKSFFGCCYTAKRKGAKPQEFPTLKAAARSLHLPAFRALREWAVKQK